MISELDYATLSDVYTKLQANLGFYSITDSEALVSELEAFTTDQCDHYHFLNPSGGCQS